MVIDKNKLTMAALVAIGAFISAIPAYVGTNGFQAHDFIQAAWAGFLAGRAYWAGLQTPTPRPEGVDRRQPEAQ